MAALLPMMMGLWYYFIFYIQSRTCIHLQVNYLFFLWYNSSIHLCTFYTKSVFYQMLYCLLSTWFNNSLNYISRFQDVSKLFLICLTTQLRKFVWKISLNNWKRKCVFTLKGFLISFKTICRYYLKEQRESLWFCILYEILLLLQFYYKFNDFQWMSFSKFTNFQN